MGRLRVIALFFCLGAAAADLDTGLVGWWRFDDGEGALALDSSGHDNHGKVSGATWVVGEVGGCLKFDGIDDVVTAANTETLREYPLGLTYELWLKPVGTQKGGALAQGGDGRFPYFEIYDGVSSLIYGVQRGGDISTIPVGIKRDVWYHCVMTYDTATHIHRAYLNGSLVREVTKAVPISPQPQQVIIGAYHRPFKGYIDEVRIYNRPLTATEVRKRFRHTASANLPPGLTMRFLTAHAEKPIYISDLSTCKPKKALSRTFAEDKWRIMPYSADSVDGKMVSAMSFVDAPAITVPVDVKGWHAVYIGIWTPEYTYDGAYSVKIKLNDDVAFRRFRFEGSRDNQDTTYIRECFFDYADLTGRDIVIGKSNGLMGLQAHVAYIKLVPLSKAQSKWVQADRAAVKTRRLAASMDGASFFHTSEITKREHILEQVALYRSSDVGKVIWAVCYGDRVNYPSKVEGTVFVGSRAGMRPGSNRTVPTNLYMRGSIQNHKQLAKFAKQGLIPQQVAAEYVHKIGRKFDIMFRMGISGGLPPTRSTHGLCARHPEVRQKLRDGTVIQKASYAYPKVQKFMLSLIREASTVIDVDGINLCFVRGPHMLWYEDPILDAFKKQYGEDARKVKPTDPRLLRVRASFMTQFLRDVRKVLDQVGKKKGKRLELSVWVWPWDRNVWLGTTPLQEGLDVKTWIKDGLLDSLYCQGAVDPSYLELCRKHNCTYTFGYGFGGIRDGVGMSPENITKAYEAGVENFMYWDLDGYQLRSDYWEHIRRIGHREEMKKWRAPLLEERLIRLKSVNGFNFKKGFGAAVYSGG